MGKLERAFLGQSRAEPAPSAQTIDGPNAAAVLTRKAPDVLLLEMRGRIGAEHAERIVGALANALRSGEPAHLFTEMSELEDYHSTLRIRVVEMFKRERARVLTIHTFSRSRIVGMGVAVVNLALGGIIKSHPTRAAFEAALQNETEHRAR